MRRLARVLRNFLVLPLLLAAVAASFIPLLETNVWWVRFMDFPRVQIGAVTLLLLLVYVLLGGGTRRRLPVAVIAAALALGYHAYRLHPYFPLQPPMAVAAGSCGEGAGLRILEANVQASNRQGDEFLSMVRQADPDVLLVLETDEWWHRQLQDLEGFPYRVHHIPSGPGYWGMHLLSRFPLHEERTVFRFGGKTPTIHADVELPAGERVAFVGMHPRPPHWWQPSTMRDAHLVAIGLDARDSDLPVVLAGDFNATPWERTNRRTMRLGGFLDPRVGRGLYPTYRAGSDLMSWPLDQVLFQPRIGLQAFRVMPGVGSDHLPLLADLCLSPALADRQHPPAPAEDDVEEARTAIEAAKALGTPD